MTRSLALGMVSTVLALGLTACAKENEPKYKIVASVVGGGERVLDENLTKAECASKRSEYAALEYVAFCYPQSYSPAD